LPHIGEMRIPDGHQIKAMHRFNLLTSSRTRKGRLFKLVLRVIGVGMVLIGFRFTLDEISSSERQASFFSELGRTMTFELVEGSAPPSLPSPFGPYDRRLGYTLLPEIASRLKERQLVTVQQARASENMRALRDWGIFPIYREKTVAGMKILDRNGETIFSSSYPTRVFSEFSEIPPLILKILLYIENRELLDPERPYFNPAVEWDRLGKAVLDKGISLFLPDHGVAGGSTLATQIEKFRHSPDGITLSAREKLYQMVSASLRSYLNGENTLAAQQEIILSYLNSVPLAGLRDYGEVIGLGDGLWAWYGADFKRVMELLRDGSPYTDKGSPGEKALALKQVLSLFIAHKRPTYYLRKDQDSLSRACDKHLHLLAEEGMLSRELEKLAIAAPLVPRTGPLPSTPHSLVKIKATNAVRTPLMNLLGMDTLYDLDRLDLTVKSTLDLSTQIAVTEEIQKLHDPLWVSRQGLMGSRLLGKEDLSKVIYSFTLYERTPEGNALRVQTDNYDQPLNINEGVKLDLGSAAKLRTLITYLEIIASLHDLYAGLNRDELTRVSVSPEDGLSKWAVSFFLGGGDKSLPGMLQAAMERAYSANPFQTFFTGGGLHTFANFDREDNKRIFSLRNGFKNSVNLVFIRLMRDIVNYYQFNERSGSGNLLLSTDHQRRSAYLEKFADYEGSEFIRKFFRKYQGKSSDQVLETLVQSIRPARHMLAAAYLFVVPDAGVEDLGAFIATRLPDSALSEEGIRAAYRKYSLGKWTLSDRAYIARIHPLELWIAAHLLQHPEARLEEVLKESAQARQEVYRWLFRTSRKAAQNKRIRTMLEIEAFVRIHEAWSRLGYPFGHLVASYATAIGSSGDRPSALAELVGIIVNDGVRVPAYRVEDLHFAEHTPYELRFMRQPSAGEQVLRPEIAQVVKEALYEVVESGTAIRVRDGFRRADGTGIRIGGKTGTGDHRYETFGTDGNLISSKVMNRSAIFVFYIGDRFFGAITAYVPGPEAQEYGFTSSLPVAILKLLGPCLTPLLETPDPKAEYAEVR
jgi:membrane peptidoglycan carboxypeptidase